MISYVSVAVVLATFVLVIAVIGLIKSKLFAEGRFAIWDVLAATAAAALVMLPLGILDGFSIGGDNGLTFGSNADKKLQQTSALRVTDHIRRADAVMLQALFARMPTKFDADHCFSEYDDEGNCQDGPDLAAHKSDKSADDFLEAVQKIHTWLVNERPIVNVAIGMNYDLPRLEMAISNILAPNGEGYGQGRWLNFVDANGKSLAACSVDYAFIADSMMKLSGEDDMKPFAVATTFLQHIANAGSVRGLVIEISPDECHTVEQYVEEGHQLRDAISKFSRRPITTELPVIDAQGRMIGQVERNEITSAAIIGLFD